MRKKWTSYAVHILSGNVKIVFSLHSAGVTKGHGSKKYLTSSDPRRDTLFWHSFWHIKCKWHISDTLSGMCSDLLLYLTCCLANILTFYLTFFLAFYLCWHADWHSVWHSIVVMNPQDYHSMLRGDLAVVSTSGSIFKSQRNIGQKAYDFPLQIIVAFVVQYSCQYKQ